MLTSEKGGETVSRKNHKWVDGKLLQTNKRFEALKEQQKVKISVWLKEEYCKAIEGRTEPLNHEQKEAVTEAVYEKIVAADIWIPYDEVRLFFRRKVQSWNLKYLPQKLK